jgi:hypothetical protein
MRIRLARLILRRVIPALDWTKERLLTVVGRLLSSDRRMRPTLD